MSASKKLGRGYAEQLLDGATEVHVAKGTKLTRFDPKKDDRDTIVAAMLGPTGNLRAPLIRSGKKLFVGFPKDGFEALKT